MDKDQPNIEEIELYLTKQMTSVEEAAFEARMEEDVQLAQEVKAWIGAKFVGFAETRQTFQSELAGRYDIAAQTKTIRLRQQMIWGIAASLLALGIFAGWWFLGRSQTVQSDQLFAEYYKPIPPDGNRSAPNQALLQEAHRSFNFGKYERAQAQYEEWIQQNPDSTAKVSLYLGQAYLNTAQAQEAIQQFQVSTDFPQESEWLTCLALIQMKDWQGAKDSLVQIAAQPAHHYQSKAKELLEILP